MSSTPNNGIPYVPEGTLDPAAGLNLSLNVIDALLQTHVISMALTAPPGSPSDGDMYIVASPATGAWAGLEDYLVRYVAEGDFWQSYVPGVNAHLALNIADGGFYKYIPGSPGGWTLAAGLSDGPNDGRRYVRRNGAWEELVLSLLNTESPAIQVDDLETLYIDSASLQLQSIAPGVGLLSARKPFAPVVSTADANTNATATNSGNYTRFSNATATYTFNDSSGFEIGAEYHGRYVGSGTLTITAAGSMTINAPVGGSLVIEPGGTFTVKIVAANQADLFGATVSA